MDLNEKNLKKVERAIRYLEDFADETAVDPAEVKQNYEDGLSNGVAIGLRTAASHLKGLFGLEEEEE